MHGDASLATRSCLCGRLFVNDFEKNIGRPIYRSITSPGECHRDAEHYSAVV